LHPAVDDRDRLARAPAGMASSRVLPADCIDPDVAELAIEEAVIRAAPKLAVGRELQAEALLQRERVLDRLVLRRCQLLARDLAALEPRAQREQLARSQQAPDVLGAERWGNGRHELNPS
jgi:hypothetical protein